MYKQSQRVANQAGVTTSGKVSVPWFFRVTAGGVPPTGMFFFDTLCSLKREEYEKSNGSIGIGALRMERTTGYGSKTGRSDW